MGRRNLSRQKSNAPIQAAFLNEIADAVEGGSNVQVGGGLRQVGNAGGRAIALDDPQPILARITGRGTGAVYSWREVYAGTSPGSFPDGYLFGTTTRGYAVEQNGNTGVVTGTRVTLYPIGGGRYRFQLNQCTTATNPPTQAPMFDGLVAGSASSGPLAQVAAAPSSSHVASLPPVPGGVF